MAATIADSWPDPAELAHVHASAWVGVAYVGAVSVWSGFFAWFRGMDWGGAGARG